MVELPTVRHAGVAKEEGEGEGEGGVVSGEGGGDGRLWVWSNCRPYVMPGLLKKRRVKVRVRNELVSEGKRE